jgi:hypothetical protein
MVRTTPGPSDAAVTYALPVLWTTLFFGRRGAIVVVGCVGLAQAIALLALPSWSAYPGRWVDVMVTVTGAALVVELLGRRNQALMRRLAGEARTDALTGLLNRRGFDERAATALAHAGRDATPIALVAFDIDHFKSVNDKWGHAAGDQVLARLGELLKAHARDVDVWLARAARSSRPCCPTATATERSRSPSGSGRRWRQHSSAAPRPCG